MESQTALDAVKKILGCTMASRLQSRWSVIPFEKELVEVGDEEAERAPYSQDDLDGCEPAVKTIEDPAARVAALKKPQRGPGAQNFRAGFFKHIRPDTSRRTDGPRACACYL